MASMQPVLKPAEQAVSGYNEGQKESRLAVLLKDGMGTAKKPSKELAEGQRAHIHRKQRFTGVVVHGMMTLHVLYLCALH